MAKIKLSDAQIAELQQYYVPLSALKDEGKRVLKKLKRLEAQIHAGSALLWECIEEIFPEIELSDTWSLNANEWYLYQKEESDGLPPSLRGLLDLLEGGGLS